MIIRWYPVLLAAFVAACASESPHDPSSGHGDLSGYEELESIKVVDAPAPVAGNFAPENRYLVERGEYLVELLG